MPPLTKNEKIAKICRIWAKDPIRGISELFNVTPTDQQKSLILAAWKPRARTAVSSSTGAGKTATLVWLTFMFLLTQEDCRVLITSPSAQQLNRVFYAEINKWYSKMPTDFKDLFDVRRENIYFKDRAHQFAALVTASADNKESLQGGHSKSYVILIDEASGVEEDVFDLLLGTLSTDEGGRLVLTSNPTRSSGRFYEIFATDRMASWDRLYFSALDCPHANREWIKEMGETYGEDSDTYRIRVLGKFPRAANSQFIASDVVERCSSLFLPSYAYGSFPIIGGLDIARFGDDSTVFCTRQGPKLLDVTKFRKLDTMEVVGEAIAYMQKHHVGVLNLDAIGVGAGCYDRLRELRINVNSVIVSNKSTEPAQYFNLRSQLYGYMKQWLENGASIPNDPDLVSQLKSMEYGFNNKMQIQLVTKKDLKRKGLQSPDIADSLALTFATDVFRRGVSRQPVQIQRSNTLWA